jgi:hypothetical protein
MSALGTRLEKLINERNRLKVEWEANRRARGQLEMPMHHKSREGCRA